MTNVKIAAEESSAMDKINNSHMPKDWQDEMTRRYYASKSLTELKIYSDCTHNLKEILKNVQDLKKKLK